MDVFGRGVIGTVVLVGMVWLCWVAGAGLGTLEKGTVMPLRHGVAMLTFCLDTTESLRKGDVCGLSVKCVWRVFGNGSSTKLVA